ncbi:CoA transferase [Glutamicibacter arilaitensis]|uniref:CoA transferase n=1 Tax=Glutamicibacter arilaitensis TaxID=256701 RepID=UPI00384E6487
MPMNRYTRGEDASHLGDVPSLDTEFTQCGLLPTVRARNWSGPRRWWGGALDVEGLAIASTELCAAAVNQLTGSQDLFAIEARRAAAAFASTEHLRVAGQQMSPFGAYSGFFQTRDGWIRTHANYVHHRQALLQALRLERPELFAESLLDVDAGEIAELITGFGGIAAKVRTRAQWQATTMGQAAAAEPWVKFVMSDVSRGRLWQYPQDVIEPLRGLRVVDFTRVIAGPTSSRTLAMLGADVLRIDPPHMPELQGQYIETGFGKRSAEMDLRDQRQLNTLHDLLSEADAVLLGYRPGALAALGLQTQQLRERYPNLIIVELRAWGDTGPYANRRGFDSIVQAACGIADEYRDAKGKPGALPVQALDHATGYAMAAAVMSLAHARRSLGQTGHAKFSLVRTATALLDQSLPTTDAEPLGRPALRKIDSTFGELVYAPPPLLRGGLALDYAGPPTPYGVDEPVWR